MPVVEPVAERLYGPLAPGFGKRIERAAALIGNKHEAGDIAGLSKDQLNKIIAEKAVPNFASIAALARKSGCSLTWLAFGDEISTRTSFSADEAETVSVASLQEGSTYPFAREWIDRLALRATDLRVLSMPNNAMEPTIARDDTLLIDTGVARPLDGGIYVFNFGDDVVVRRTQRETDGSIILRADNAKYEAMRLSANLSEAVKLLGRVVWQAAPI